MIQICLFLFFEVGGGGAKDDLTIRTPQRVNLKRFSQIGSIKYQMYQCTMLQGSIHYNLTGIGVKIKNILKPPPSNDTRISPATKNHIRIRRLTSVERIGRTLHDVGRGIAPKSGGFQ